MRFKPRVSLRSALQSPRNCRKQKIYNENRVGLQSSRKDLPQPSADKNIRRTAENEAWTRVSVNGAFMNTFIRQKRQRDRQKDRQKKAVYICKLQANYNTERTNDHKNWS